MKRFTIRLLLATVALTSFAGHAQEREAGTPGVITTPGEQTPPGFIKDFAAGKKRGKPARRNLSAQDFVGNFVWYGTNFLDGVYQPNGGCLSITPDPYVDGQLLINGFVSEFELKGYVKDDRLYIPNQKIWHSDVYDEDAWFWNSSLKVGVNDAGEKRYEHDFEPDSPFYFMMDEGRYLYAGNNNLYDKEKWNSFGYSENELKEMVCIATEWMPGKYVGFWLLCGWISATNLNDYFTYYNSDWTYVGEATFKDAWLEYIWGGDTPVYDVPLYRYNDDHNIFLLKDPYGPLTPFGKEKKSIDTGKEGYIIFNIFDPETVFFYPFYYGGTLDYASVPTDFYLYDTAGYDYCEWGYSWDEVKELSISFSTFDPQSRIVNISDASFSYNWENIMYNLRYWNDYDMKGYIILPENYNAAVEDIINDVENSPVEYFNLQGQRIENPKEGDVIIVRKGNKASKIIMR